jgi:hypothetical protein
VRHCRTNTDRPRQKLQNLLLIARLEISNRVEAVAVRRKVQRAKLAQNKSIRPLDIAPLDRNRWALFLLLGDELQLHGAKTEFAIRSGQ